MKLRRIISTIIITGILLIAFCSCNSSGNEKSSSATEPTVEIEGLECDVFSISSENLKDGVWDTCISNTKNGSNQSPQLSWESVEDAKYYSVYMVDTSAGNWIHWKSEYLEETSLKLGWASSTEYKGPCPPSGTHSYEIYVFALKEKPSAKLNIFLNARCATFFKQVIALDLLEDGSKGNVVAFGHIKGTYTYGD